MTDSAPALGMRAAKHRFALNVGSNVGYLALSMVVGLWLTRYLLTQLGVAVFGLVPLATSVTTYMSVLTQGLNMATGRFLTIDLVRGDQQAANNTFNSALFTSWLVAVALLPVVLGVSMAAPLVFRVPMGSETDARWLFLFVGLAFLVSLVASCFSVPTFSYNRFDLDNLVKALHLLVRSGVVVALFLVWTPQLWQTGVATLASAVASYLAYLLVWRKLTPQLKVRFRDFDRSRLRELIGMGTWVVVNQFGALLFLNIDLIVVNLVFGAEATGRYGSVLQFSALLRSLALAVSGVLTPVIIAKYAQHDEAGMERVSHQAVKLMGLGIALPVGLLCGLARPLLGVWLGSAFQDLSILLVVLLVHLSINLAVLPLFPIQTSTNRVRWPGIVTLVTGFVNLGLAIALARWGGWGVVGVAAAGALVLTGKNALFTPIYNAHILGLRWWAFLPDLVWGTLATMAVLLGTLGILQLYQPSSWLGLIAVCIAVTMLYGLGIYGLALNRVDRQLLRSFGARAIRA